MKITKRQLKKIIKTVLKESYQWPLMMYNDGYHVKFSHSRGKKFFDEDSDGIAQALMDAKDEGYTEVVEVDMDGEESDPRPIDEEIKYFEGKSTQRRSY